MKNRTKKTLSYIFASAVITAATVWTATRFMTFGHVEFTDNAQIRQQIVPVNSRVQGFIREIRFKEYSPVKKGDTLVIIDDSDLRVRVAKARAGYGAALAAQSVTDRNATAASANVSVSEASVQEARIVMENAKADYLRLRTSLRLVGIAGNMVRHCHRLGVRIDQPMARHIPASSVYQFHGDDQQKRSQGIVAVSCILHNAWNGTCDRRNLHGSCPRL